MTRDGSIPVLPIVGAPNVGKSTLFNRLTGRRQAIVTDEPGVTRDRLYGVVEYGGLAFELVDTGGLAPGLDLPFADAVARQVEQALAEARAVLFVVDARAGLTAIDREIAGLLRKRGVPAILVANKADTAELESAALVLHELGLGEPIPVSAEHGRGIVELLDVLEQRLEGQGTQADAPVGERPAAVRLALVGRPNVGKSSLVNRLVGEERVVVSETPGTTRDAVDILLERDETRWLLVDTAGIRRPGRVRLTADAAALAHAQRAIERADVVAVVLDAIEGIVAQDTHIAGRAFESHRPAVLVVNKWDLVTDREEAAKRWEGEVRRRFRFARHAPVIFTSARTGQRVSRVLEVAKELHEVAGRRVSTAELNRWLREESEAERSSPAAGRSVNLLYATQVGVHPPRFVLFCSDPRRVHFSLRRHLANALQDRFGFGAAPVHLSFRGRRRSRS